MNIQDIIRTAAEMFGFDEELIAGVYDIETLSEDEALNKYGVEMFNKLQDTAEDLPFDWYKQAKAAMGKLKSPMRITETDITKMVNESIRRILGY